MPLFVSIMRHNLNRSLLDPILIIHTDYANLSVLLLVILRG